MSGMERIRTFTRDGLVFDVRDEGPIDGTPVVLLHGFPQDSRSWDELAPLLHRRGFRTLAPDQRGYSAGARPRARWAYRGSELVADVVALIDQAGLGPAHVVGHDWGAVVAWGIAAERPDRVRTLTALSVPHPAAFVRAMLTSRQILKSWYMFAFQLPWIPERLITPDGYGYRALLASGQSADRAKRDLEPMRDRTRARGALNWYRAMPFTAPRSASRKVRVPTLFVWSDGDSAIGPVGPALTSRFVDGPYTYEVFRGVSHWIPDEAAERVDELLGSHLLDQS
ncbi:alpha/beta fold hydrolase [Rhodococcus opacus]|uniref:Alpha/beta fold hydrolase n=2 Tax=Rhodococcus opacus TaxID=37919 RepID=A0AAX3Y8G6_RHOOP|nr:MULTISPECIES: alpha/beta fold hydrolase [Rhodococcus]NHU47908.1 alpha/beta fold hydrolase [Rhodococcus sp. A14]MBA8964797.1 pimeloyl-ACP methyl ester carboxylesterase [Rhodococcus opacus]MBP2208349.1 pimeloyl-ACP methyl ester carboxylesterase [Rhodococcus opacus]MCZ4583256.1 alpha/beta fold hydrolase [Rhodococcus opacus]MDI9940600.1 alpha/beta fold hydrolase [Rhodococcus sp. IEGM 1351]